MSGFPAAATPERTWEVFQAMQLDLEIEKALLRTLEQDSAALIAQGLHNPALLAGMVTLAGQVRQRLESRMTLLDVAQQRLQVVADVLAQEGGDFA